MKVQGFERGELRVKSLRGCARPAMLRVYEAQIIRERLQEYLPKCKNHARAVMADYLISMIDKALQNPHGRSGNGCVLINVTNSTGQFLAHFCDGLAQSRIIHAAACSLDTVAARSKFDDIFSVLRGLITKYGYIDVQSVWASCVAERETIILQKREQRERDKERKQIKEHS